MSYLETSGGTIDKNRQLNRLGHYLQALMVVVICTLVAAILFPYFASANLSMVYLTGIVISALFYGKGPSILATILSVATLDFLFIEPYGTFAVSDVQYVLSLFVMLMVAVTVSTLALRSRQQTEMAQMREYRTASLYAMNRKFSNVQGVQAVIDAAIQHVNAEFASFGRIYVIEHGNIRYATSFKPEHGIPEPEIEIARWVYNQGIPAGNGTDNSPGSSYLYIPLRALQTVVGVLAIYVASYRQPMSNASRQFLGTFADQIAVAIERVALTEAAQQARMQAETERLRSNLLSSVSHDFRTPLSSIMGAASTLLEKGGSLDPKTHEELSQLAYEEAQRLDRLVGNLLDMTRLESGGLHVEKEWQTLEEVIGAALHHLGSRRSSHPILTDLPSALPLVPMDSVLIEQVLLNLLENAIKYTPADTPIRLSAIADGNQVAVEVADSGPGIVRGDEERIFDKFYRSKGAGSSGVGLGLTICKGIIEAHSGKVWAENRSAGGAVFHFTLPLEGGQPEFDEEP